MSSDFKVPYTKIIAINTHPNADKLELATVYGFQVVVKKGQYQVGDAVVYIPVDSILPVELESRLFPAESKIKLSGSRVRQIRIRGFPSQGMLVDIKDLSLKANVKCEQDLAEYIGVTKYEPPETGPAQTVGKAKNRNKKSEHPLFHKYNGLGNIKWFPDLFQAGEEVVVQEKLHGTNARASLLPYNANTLWKKVKSFLKLSPAYEQCYGSNNVDISARSSYKGYYGEDLYGAAFAKASVFTKLLPNETVFGEIVGPGIQKNYAYGETEHKFVLFDVKKLMPDGTQIWLSPSEVEQYAKERGFEHVPVLYRGEFNKDMITALASGPSVYCPKQKVIEGVVIKAKNNYCIAGNKKALKLINPEYLDDKSNTDNH
jgi:RNA ligase (TIGR02306 family)